MEKILEARNLCKEFVVNNVNNQVLKDINLSVNEGEFIAIMGPSGSGKSTLLYTLSGMDNVSSGDVNLCDVSITNKNENELADLRLNKMGFIFQQMNMLRTLSIYDNIIISAFNKKSLKNDRKQINDYANELLKKLGISEIANNDITEVSGGQLQRACICRALINNPKIIFADEPTGSLNSKASQSVIDELCKINEEGKTIVLVTHDVKVAAKTKKVIFLMDGIIKGEYRFINQNSEPKAKEEALSKWLMELGW